MSSTWLSSGPIGRLESRIPPLPRFAVAGLCFALAAGSAAAAEPLSLAEALKIAVSGSPQLASQRAMVDASHEMVVPSGELPDPKLKVGVENVPTEGPDAWTLTRDNMTMSKIGLMQEFPRAEKRRLKAQRAEREAERGTVAVESTTLVVSRDAASAWLARRYAADAERLIAAQIGEADLAVSTVMAAYRAGKAPQGDLIAAQSAVVELRNRATEAAAQSRRARIALARYVGAAEAERPPGEAPDIARLPDDKRLADVDLQPELRLAQAQEAVAAADAEIARAAKLPDWSVEASYAVRGSPYANMVSVMFSIDLPWSPGTRQDREYAAKLKELDAARAMREDARRTRSAEVESMRVEWESARAQAERIRADLLPLVVQRVDAALAAYRGGTGPLTAVLDARRAELDAELALVNQQLALAKAWAYLNFVVPEGS